MNNPRVRAAIPAVAVLVVIALLLLLPPVGVIAAAIALATLPPWGRTITERAIISAVVTLALVAIIFPRNGSTPIDSVTARIFLAALVTFTAALSAIPQIRSTSLAVPKLDRPKLLDYLTLTFFAASFLWLLFVYIGTDDYQTLSGMFLSGWDNQGHFITFSNTYAVGSTTWPTVDGSEAFNQWYPSLHTTFWSLGQYAFSGSGISRIGLLFPFITWQAISFAGCVAALAWVSGDLAGRITSAKKPHLVGALAFILTALFLTLGSPALMFNSGFVNFVMGVTVVAVVSYLSVRSPRSSITLGWFLIPLGAIVSINLWTPLVIGVIPAGLVVLARLFRSNKGLAILWFVGSALVAGWLGYTQAQAIIRPGSSASELNSEIGAVGVGMPAFNISLALAMPVLALAFIAITKKHRVLAIGVAGSALFFSALAVVFSLGADSATVSRVSSYYVLKALAGSLIAYMPIIFALIAVACALAVAAFTARQQALAAASLILFGTVAYGYVGTTETELSPGFAAAPGVQAFKDRKEGVNNSLVGVGIISAAEVALDNPDRTPFLWDGAGTLPNLWVNSLTGVLSTNAQKFYAQLPPFPYDESTLDYVNFSLSIDPTLDLNVLWFRDVSGELLNGWAAGKDPQRVITSRVLIPSSPLCEECTLTP